VNLYLSGGTAAGGAHKWHYISLPIQNINVSTFNTLNLVQYIESLVTGPDNYPGWVGYDGYQYSTGNNLPYTFDNLILGKGYNYFHSSGQSFEFTGTINTAEYSEQINLTCGSGYPDYQGYNLIGNPFASCLDWDHMVSNHYVQGSVDDAIYFTTDGKVASYVNGIGADGGSGTIPPLQGFFVKANSNSSLIFPRAARVHELDQFRYKKGIEDYVKSSDTIAFLRLKMETLQDSAELVVRFNTKATAGSDKEFDAYEFSKTTGDINIWTSSLGTAYSINGLPFPETEKEIPVGLNKNIAGLFKLSSSEIRKLDHYNILLIDITSGQTVDLKKGGFIEFFAEPGLTEDRFIIAITKTTTNIPVVDTKKDKFNIYLSGGTINVVLLTDDTKSASGSIAIHEITGKKVTEQKNIQWSGNGDRKQISTNTYTPGLYIVTVTSGINKYTKKVILH
jgi:hypothetical protein